MKEQIQLTMSLKRVFNIEQKSYYEKLKAEMAAIARNRTPREMYAENDLKSLREWTERRRKAIEFLETKKMPNERIKQIIEEAAEKTKEFFEERAREFGIEPPKLDISEITRELTEEHLNALDEVFGIGNLEPIIMPKPESLDNDYFEMMFPREQREEDEARGLISYRPDWWEEEADAEVVGPKEETWEEAYLRSMKAEAERLQGKIIFTESIRKPKHAYVGQQYGTEEGKDKTKDPLLAIIQDVFGEEANRYNLSWDEINMRVLPKVKEEIKKEFQARGLAVPSFEVIITPALVKNEQITEKHPENSQGSTSEWTSTVFERQDGTDSGRRLLLESYEDRAGEDDYGGASYVKNGLRDSPWHDRGFCLSVVFE